MHAHEEGKYSNKEFAGRYTSFTYIHLYWCSTQWLCAVLYRFMSHAVLDLVWQVARSIAEQCRTNLWLAVPDWTLMAQCQCRIAAADYGEKCRFRTNFFPAFRHLHMIFQPYSKNNTIRSRLWKCRVYCFPPPADWTCTGYPFHPPPTPAVWTCRVYPFPPPAV